MALDIGHRVDLGHPRLDPRVAHVQSSRHEHAPADPGHQAGRDVGLDAQELGLGEHHQGLSGLHRVTEFDQLAHDHAVEGGSGPGVAQTGVEFLDPGARLQDLGPRLVDLRALVVEIGGPIDVGIAEAEHVAHVAGEHLVEHRRHAHAGRAIDVVALRRPEFARILHPGVAQGGIGLVELGQRGAALGLDIVVVDRHQNLTGVEPVALGPGQELHAPRDLRRQGHFLERNDRAAQRHGSGTAARFHGHDLDRVRRQDQRAGQQSDGRASEQSCQALESHMNSFLVDRIHRDCIRVSGRNLPGPRSARLPTSPRSCAQRDAPAADSSRPRCSCPGRSGVDGRCTPC